MYNIPYLDLKQVTSSFNGELEKKVVDVVSSGRYLMGEETSSFEREYADFLGTNHVIACSSGMTALSLMLRAYLELGKMNPGDEVIVPANTFIASINAIVEVGLRPVLVEPDLDTCNIDANKIEEAITPRTSAIMLVHLYGRCAYSDKISRLCQLHDLLLFEDNAQAHGCRFQDGRLTGSLGHAAAHSFYPGKNLGALGDAGAISTSDSQVAHVVRSLANYGSSKKYVFDYVGQNARMDEVQAAVLRVKLKRLTQDNGRRQNIAIRYMKEIHNPYLRLPKVDDISGHVFHIFPVFSKYRDALQSHFLRQGIGTLIHYPIAPHLQKCYKSSELLIYPKDNAGNAVLPISERLHSEELSLPLSPVLSDADVDAVIKVANSFKPIE